MSENKRFQIKPFGAKPVSFVSNRRASQTKEFRVIHKKFVFEISPLVHITCLKRSKKFV